MRVNKAKRKFLVSTKILLAERVAYMCSNPMCRRLTIKPNAINELKATRIGEAGHIYGISGARFDENKSDAYVRSPKNGVWLCEPCHKIVDSEDSIYKAETLEKWKADTEAYVQELVMQDTRLRQLRFLCQNYLSALRILSALPLKLDQTFETPNGNNINLTRLSMELELTLFDNQFLEEADILKLIISDLDNLVCPFVDNNQTGQQVNISSWKNQAVKILMISIMHFSSASYQRYFDRENEMVKTEINRLLKINVTPRTLNYSATEISKIQLPIT